MADKHKLHNINNKFSDSLKKLRERKAKLETEIAEYTREKDVLVSSLTYLICYLEQNVYKSNLYTLLKLSLHFEEGHL